MEPAAAEIISMVWHHDYNGARAAVLTAARQGRATYVPAGARDNDTARVLVDGIDVGQASSLMHYVREDYGKLFGSRVSTAMFAERPLVEGYPHQIPTALR